MKQSPIDEAQALIVKGQTDAAIQLLSETLNGDFFHREVLFLLGGCLISKGMNGLAAVITSAAIDAHQASGKKIGFVEAMMNLGYCYKVEHKNETALKIWQDTLRQERLPRERAKILTNIAGLYVNEAQPKKAIEYCDMALAEDPGNSGAKANRGLACLELGRWREGWQGYHFTIEAGDRPKRFYPNIPDWDGSFDKTVIVYGDQGIGDEIYFATCLPDMIKHCKHVILDCHPRLEHLFRRSFPEITVHGTRKDLSELPWVRDSGATACIGLSDLPLWFRNEDEKWRGEAYLKAKRPEGVLADMPYALHGAADVRAKLGMPLRIGLSWTGGSKKTRQDLRSLPIYALEPILRARPDAAWYSLQYTPDAAREVCELEERTGIRISHYPGWVECFDYDRTASFVSSLDLVICVTTAIHDLASGLGVPNWVLVPMRTGWRFQLKGERLPWYDSTRLFRQDKDGDWSGPILKVADELSKGLILVNQSGISRASERAA